MTDLNWKVQGTGDFNGDGKSDIFWHRVGSGDTSIGLMNGVAIGSHGPAPGVSDLNWQIQNPK